MNAEATTSTARDRRRTDVRGLRTISLEPPDRAADRTRRETAPDDAEQSGPAVSTGEPAAQAKPPNRFRTAPDRIALFAGDRLLAAAFGGVVRVYDAGRFGDTPSSPLAEVGLRGEVDRLAGIGAEDLAAVLADGTVWRIAAIARGKPTVAKLADLSGRVRALVPTRAGFVAMVEGSGGRDLVEIDASRGALRRRAPLPFARVSTVSALDDRGTLVVVDERHGAHIVRFDPRSDADRIEVAALDEDARVTAAADGAKGWHVVARKGGQVRKARLDPARGDLDDVCRRLRELFKACGCGCHDDTPGDGPGDPTHPGGEDPGRPGGHDDEECGRRHRAQLTWTVAQLARTGPYLTAVSAAGDRMAVLDADLTVLLERGLSRATVVTGSTGSDRIAILDRRGRVEIWDLAEYVVSAGIRPKPVPPPVFTAPVAETAVFYGQRSAPASPNPHLRIAIIPVIEPGQVFGDSDQSKLHALQSTNVFAIAQAYYEEASFQTLTPEFSVFGVDIGGTGVPVTLPASFASYFWDEFRAGGLEAEMPAAWPTTIDLDGREELTLRTHPSKGSSRDYELEFAALWTRQTHSSFPVDVTFAGGETLDLEVTQPDGTNHTLSLAFGALAESLTQGGDESAFLDALGQHVTDAVRDAESAAGTGQLVEDVVFRRIRTSSSDDQFGRLLGQWRIAGGGAGKGSIEIVAPGGATPAGVEALGLDGSGAVLNPGTLASRADIESYLRDCLDATIRDAGEGPGLNDTQLHNVPTTTEDAAAQIVTAVIRLSDEYGGSLASITREASSGLSGTGWSSSTPQDGSETNYNSRNALRHSAKLAHDTFTAAMDRIRAQGPWDREAVRTEFSQFDGLMIAFVGPCPAGPADPWQCTAAVDQSRFRMFVRRHYATDENDPDPSATPVSMPTDLVIGQRFDRFDAAVMNHEIGHGLGLPDLYSATGFRDDVQYVDDWCNMAGNNGDYNHLCAWSKWFVDWIPESPDAAVNRVIEVPMPEPTGVSSTEAWLVPVEHWDNSMRADVEAAVGTSVPIGQMMRIHLGSDGGVFDIAEFRAPGDGFSLNLSPVPAVIVTNVLDPDTDRRWAVNGLYRRSVHLLNQGNELTAAGDTWDFAAGAEFPLKGCLAEIVDIQTIRGGSLPICRLRIDREAAEFIDLYFDDNVPSWRSPDIWVDWRGDNADADEPRIYPEGTPTDQGEAVRFPGSGSEPHFVVARPHNAGNVHAEDVRVRWFICDPPGAGDDGRWVERDTTTLAQLDDGTWEAIPFTWNVTPDVDSHQCLRAEIIDWTIPSGVDPATGDTVALAGDDVVLQNNMAQKNVFDFEAAT